MGVYKKKICIFDQKDQGDSKRYDKEKLIREGPMNANQGFPSKK